jgi:endonuclease YncB( thermonuclease family)
MGCTTSRIDSNSNVQEIPHDAPLQRYDFKQCCVISVYDGDTYTVIAKHRGEYTKFPVRLYGVDTCELRGGTAESKHLAYQAKHYVESMILNKVVDCIVFTNSDNPINDKYGRLMVSICINNTNLAIDLIEKKLAKEYFGGTKSTS